MSKAKPTTTAQIGDFVLNNDAEYDWTVYPLVPGARGKRDKLRIGARFKHVPATRRIEILDEFRENMKRRAKPAGDSGEDINEVDELSVAKDVLSFEGLLLDEVLIDFKHVRDANGNAVPCTPETKQMLLENSWARSALFNGYMQSLQSRDDTGN